MKKIHRFLFLFFLIATVLCALPACSRHYAIHFETNGGDPIPDAYFSNDENWRYYELDDIIPKKENYIFLGWYEDQELNSVQIPSAENQKKDVTVYARWHPMFQLNEDGGYTLDIYHQSKTYGGFATPEDANYEIPESCNGKPVNAIGESAFSYTNLESVTIPASVKRIESNAFLYCNKLKSVTFDENCYFESIKSDAFSSNEITEFTVPRCNQTFQNDSPISSCSNLKKVTFLDDNFWTLPDNVEEIVFKNGISEHEYNRFKNTIWYANYWKDPSSRVESGIAYSGKTAIRYFERNAEASENVEFAPDTTRIAAGCFEGVTTVVNITCPKSLKIIEDNAFGDFSIKGKITLNEGMEYLGDMPENYFGTYVRDDFFLPSTLKYIGDSCCYRSDLTQLPSGLEAVGRSAFANCTKLKNLPESLKTIGSGAFAECTGLTAVPEGVETIPETAFANCTGLTSLPASIKSIGSSAFFGCTGLTSLPAGIESVGSTAFAECTGISAIPSGIREVGTNAFQNTAWEAAEPAGVVYYGTTAIGFHGSAGGKLTIRDGTTNITDQVFAGQGFSEVVLPTSLREIGDYAFAFCKISKIRFPAKLKSIGKNAFLYNLSLSEINFPESLETIGSGAFSYCGIKSAILPDTIRTFSGAFSDCRDLKAFRVPRGSVSASIPNSVEEVWLPASLKRVSLDEHVKKVRFEADSIEDLPYSLFRTLNKFANKKNAVLILGDSGDDRF